MNFVDFDFFILATFQYLVFARSSKCDSDRDGCCTNYYKVDGVCTECPVGTFGVGCSGKCPEDYFGRLCKKKCDCLHYQYCNPVFGCQNIGNTTESNKTRCVQNYYLSNGICKECPNGTFGVNCKKTCPNNYFGHLCGATCHCFDNQYCDSAKGCLFNDTSTSNKETNVSEVTTECAVGTFGVNCSQTCPPNVYGRLCQRASIRLRTSKWKTISFALIGVGLSVLIAAGVFCFRSRLKTCKERQPFSHTEENQGEYSLADQDIEVADQRNRNHSVERYAPEERKEFSNVFDDLRSSQIIDKHPASASDTYRFADCSQETFSEDTSDTNYGCVSKRQYLNSYTEANGNSDSANNYEHFQMLTEYSILSLKRNIDPAAIELHCRCERGTNDVYDVQVGQFQDINESGESSLSESESETCLSFTRTQYLS